MTSTWTLLDATGHLQSLADWGLNDLTRELINQQPDSVTFRAEGRASDADPLFAFGSTVQIFRDGVVWFTGRVVQVPARASAAAEDQLYRLAGPWWYLENLVFQQTWQSTDGVDSTLIPINKSRIILTQKADGTKLNTGQAIQEVLTYATSLGVPITLGEITPNAFAPYSEVLDASCAEVIRTLLRWTPDAVATFDYTTAPYPTLSIFRRADAIAVTLPAYGSPVSELELTPRYDLQRPSVVLKFEQTNVLDSESYTALIVQPAPTTTTGNELGAWVMTLDLAGARATYQKQNVLVQPLPTGATDSGVIAWWKTRFPWLNDFDDSTLSVVSGSFSVAVENPASYPGITTSELPNEVLEGSIAPWMNVHAAPLILHSTLQYSGPSTTESNDVWGAAGTRDLYARIIGTDATSQTYSRLTSAIDGEPVPANLAAALYAAVSILQYDGRVVLVEEECSSQVKPGQLLNLTGGRAEWTTMNAQVQRVVENVNLGQTTLVVGPAHHLGHADLQELLRANALRRPSYRLSERTTGHATGNATQTDGGQHQPRSDSTHRPSAGGTSLPNTPFELLNVSDTTGLKVEVNPNSKLQQSLTPNDTLTVTGVGTPIAVSVGTLIWLEVDFDATLAVTGVSIQSGSGWSGFPNPFLFTSGAAPLQSAFLLIGYLAAATSPLDGTVISGGPSSSPVTAKIIQCVSGPLLLRSGAANGYAVVYPFPNPAPYLT